MLSISIETIIPKSTSYQINLQQYRFLYELIARHSNIFVWSRINKHYSRNYSGFLDLYFKLEDDDRLPLINELHFIIEGLVSIQKPSELDSSELKNHLLAVTQFPLIEITNTTRNIPALNMQEVLRNPYSLSIVEQYNKHLSALNIIIQAFINSSNKKWNEIYEKSNNPDIMKTIKVSETSDGLEIFDVEFEENEVSEATDMFMNKMLSYLKKCDPRFHTVKNFDEFDNTNEKIHSMQTITENKLLDEKITKAFFNFFDSLSPEDRLAFDELMVQRDSN